MPAEIIEFPGNKTAEPPFDYAGRTLMLNVEKARKWQCFGFYVGLNHRIDVVPETANLEAIAAAVDAGVLLDLTEHPELFKPSELPENMTFSETDTGAKVYSGSHRFFRELGLDDDPGAPDEEIVAYATSDKDEQSKIEDALRSEPVAKSAPLSIEEARRRASRTLIELAPGMDHPEKYLIVS